MKISFLKEEVIRADHLSYVRLWIWLGVTFVSLIVLLSLISVPSSIAGIRVSDKLLHCAVYACLMGWFAQIFRHDMVRALLVVLFVAMGIAVEYAQALTPTRNFEVLDMVANTSGVVLAWALSYTWVGSLLEWFERSVLRTPLATLE